MQQSFGRYRLIRHLATGGMGEVYLAEAVGAAGFSKRLVIKTLRPALSADERLVAQFVAEGRLLEALDHPNIAQILDLGMFEGTYFLAMEYVEGRDLRDLRRALPAEEGGQRLDEISVLGIVADTAEALAHASGRAGADGQPLRIVHHDVTPSNIMVRRDGHVKLVDFGVARSAVWQRLEAGSLRGKLPYLSPEQASLADADDRADVFSLGLVAFELLTGHKAMDVSEPEELSAAFDGLGHRLGDLDRLEVGPETRDLVTEMMALDRDVRVASAELVAERAKLRLVELGVASTARPLSQALEPAFDQLDRQASGFDHTLSSLVAAGPGALGTPGGGAESGTVSLPGLSGLAGVASEPPGSRPPVLTAPQATGLTRPRKRVLFASIVLLLLAGVVGWWLGATRPSPSATQERAAAQPAEDAAAAPIASTPAVAPTAPAPAAVTPTLPPEPTPQPVTVAPKAQPDAESVPPDALSAAAAPPPNAIKRASATLRFLVFPAYCQVLVDGRRQRLKASGRYSIELAPGRHRVVVHDPTSGQRKSQTVTLQAGEARTLPGGFRLVTDLP